MHVLIVGTARPAHDELVAAGHSTALLLSRGLLKASDLKLPHTSIHGFDHDATPDDYAAIAERLHGRRPFDAICSLHDNAQRHAIEVARRLGLPLRLTEAALANVVEKARTRTALRCAGVDTTAFRVVADEAELREFVAAQPCASILKPCAATGSSGVRKVNGLHEVPDAIAWCRQCGHDFPLLVEEYLDGPEYSIEAISEGGEHRVLAITEKFKTAVSFVECGHVVPARLQAGDEALLVALVRAALTALAITDGPTHTEAILTVAGPRFVETHTRPGGDNIHRLLELSTGINLFQLAVRQCLGERVLHLLPEDLPKRRSAAIWYGLPDEQTYGTVKRVYKPDTVVLDVSSGEPAIVETTLLKHVGDSLAGVTSSSDRIAYAIAVGADSDAALDTARAAVEQIAFEVAE